MKSLMRAGALALIAAGLLAGCAKKGGEAKGATPAAKSTTQARLVRVARVAPRTLAGGMEAPGILISREEAAVAPEIKLFIL
jgi:HlyD family secretion protein